MASTTVLLRWLAEAGQLATSRSIAELHVKASDPDHHGLTCSVEALPGFIGVSVRGGPKVSAGIAYEELASAPDDAENPITRALQSLLDQVSGWERDRNKHKPRPSGLST